MSSEIAPICEDEVADGAIETYGRASTPDVEGVSKSTLANQKRSPAPSRSSAASLTPIGSPTPERLSAQLYPQDEKPFQQFRPAQDRPHANSWTFCDLFGGQERPNSAPLEQRPMGAAPPTPGSKDSSPNSTTPITSAAAAAAFATYASTTMKGSKTNALSLEQPTFHPQPRRHQPWVTPLLESEASPVPQSPEAAAGREKGLKLSSSSSSWNRNAPSWDEVGSYGAGRELNALGGFSEDPRRSSSGGGGAGSAEPFASTPSPERDIHGHGTTLSATALRIAESQEDWMVESPKPGISGRSVQNTPEPNHYHYGAGHPISTPSPGAMTGLGQSHHFMGLPPRFPHGGMMMPPYGPGPMLPPPLPTPSGGAGTMSSPDIMGLGFGGAFRPTPQEAAASAAFAESQLADSGKVVGLLGDSMHGLGPMAFQEVQQLAASYHYQQAYHFGAAAAAAAASAGGWRVPACPPMPMGCHAGSFADTLAGLCEAPPTLSANALPSNGQAESQTYPGAGAGQLSQAAPAGPVEWQNAASEALRPDAHAKGDGVGDLWTRQGKTQSRSGSGANGTGGGGSKYDLSTLPSEAAELVGNVGHMSKLQACSKYLQRQLLKGQPATIHVILDGVEEEIAALMCDAYGNYLCSVAFQACSQRQRMRMLEKLAPKVASIACDKRGTHALQALIGLLTIQEEQQQLMSSIQQHVIPLCMDANGTHVVQRLLFCFMPVVSELIFVAVIERMVEVAHHPYGLCVLKKCISQATVPGRHHEMLLSQLTRHALDLVQSPYGNYAIQHALEEWGGECCTPIFRKLEGRMMLLSIQKFSSNVVEKLFCSAPEEFRTRFISELVESEKMSVLVNSNYGHYVAKRALQLATPEQAQALTEAIRANLASLPNRRLRVKWEKVMAGVDDDDDDWERQGPPQMDAQPSGAYGAVPYGHQGAAAGYRRGKGGGKHGGGGRGGGKSHPGKMRGGGGGHLSGQ
ncbi:unnamed protein product [Polarella glacialis]|uniref:PUM-HD domain-containing protein n=1 Tax=Polarella glacialis TaxID=89957 RepID=A0A813DGC3_POLGL|nr:unnamed protein product [Polarella glacialis]